jgi:hypothetical protein
MAAGHDLMLKELGLQFAQRESKQLQVFHETIYG